MKRRLNLTIKRMLGALVFIGISVIVVLMLISFYSARQLIQSQNRLTETVLPLESANQGIQGAVADFIQRQGRIVGARALEALQSLADRKPLEHKFEQSRDRLKALSVDKLKAKQHIRRLNRTYGAFLSADQALFEAAHKVLSLEETIAAQLAIMDQAGTQLHKSAEDIFGKINLEATRQRVRLRKTMQSEEISPQQFHARQEAIAELAEGELSRIQKSCTDLRLAVAALATQGRQLLLVQSPEQLASLKGNQIAQAASQVESALNFLKDALGETPEQMAILQKIEGDFNLFITTLVRGEDSLARLRGRWLEQKGLLDEHRRNLRTHTAAIQGSLSSLQKLAQKVRSDAEERARAVKRMGGKLIVGFGLIGVLFTAMTGWLIRRRIIGPISQTIDFADTIARGDLTARIQLKHSDLMQKIRLEQSDEIGELVYRLSQMAHSLNALIGQVQRSGVQVSSSATELSATAKEQEAVLREQVESTKYVVSSVSEISSLSADLVETVQQVAAKSGETAEFAASGQSDLARMEAAISHMENASKSISGKLEAINEKAANITSVVTTITKVADQTNLLSLNAAIEAEKAGDSGRGFTVVAREIRRLADQTAVATLDIEQMVQEMQSAVSAGVMEMDAFIAEVQRSAEDVSRISEQLSRIIDQVQNLSPSFGTVNEAMQRQSGNADEINRAMRRLSDEMEQTASGLQESFLAIDQLNEAAQGLQDEVSRFKVASDE